MQRVALAAGGVLLRGLRSELVAQELREPSVRLPRARGTALELGAHERARGRVVERRRGGLPAHELGVERVRAGELVGLLGALGDLPDRGCQAARGTGAQRLDVAVDCLRQRVEARGDVLPRLDVARGHEVEHVAQRLHGRGDVVQVPQVLAGLVQLDVQPEPLAHRGERDAVDVVRGLDRVQLAQRRAGGGVTLVVALRGQVGHLVVVAGQTHLGRGERVEGGEGGDVLLGNGIDGRGFTHALDPTRQ